jgi:hypothetical protein|tara:strand:- start:2229 stop:2666 length:438 start_codon:yes stop_codon:yes gene_type:complete
MTRKIRFALPKRFEITLLVAMVFLLFLSDINLNKSIDLGLDYRVTIFGDLMIKAILLFWLAIIMYHIILSILVIRAILETRTHYIFDWIVAVVMFFGTMILLSGALLHFSTDTVPVFVYTIGITSYYHFGILLQVFGAFYFALTE